MKVSKKEEWITRNNYKNIIEPKKEMRQTNKDNFIEDTKRHEI